MEQELRTCHYNQDKQMIISEHLNLPEDRLKQQKTTQSATHVRKEQETGRLTKTGEYKIGEKLYGLISRDFCCNV